MLKLETTNSTLIPTFLVEAEKQILQERELKRILPLTRLYLATCKVKKDVNRMRKTCLDALYFMGDLVIPFLYVVLTSWAEVLPLRSECHSKKIKQAFVLMFH